MTSPHSSGSFAAGHTLSTLVGKFSRTPAEAITAASRFDGLDGWGSLAALRLLTAVEAEYAVSLDLLTFMRTATVGELAGQIEEQLAKRLANDKEGTS